MEDKKTEKFSKPKTEHNWYYVGLVLGLILLYTICIGFNILSSIGSAKRKYFVKFRFGKLITVSYFISFSFIYLKLSLNPMLETYQILIPLK